MNGEGAAARPAAPADRYLYPGDLVVTREAGALVTILGSCVSVCLSAAGRGGGMNHYLLPEGTGATNALRYGAPAIGELLRRLREIGCPPGQLQARVFGGASPAGLGGKLGEANVALAARLLREAGIPVIAQDVGGSRGRRVRFDPLSGAAAVSWV